MFSFFYTRGGAGHVRGIQVADWLKAKKNPTVDFKEDVCIYIKMEPPEDFPRHSYLDVVDAPRAVRFAKEHPSIGVIAISRVAQRHLCSLLGREDVFFIPHHHCNFENELRPDREVKTVGIIGSRNSFQFPAEELREKLKAIGLELLYDQDHWQHYNNEPNEEGKDSREKVCRFYQKVDIQVVFRPEAWSPAFEPLRSPLKLENAGSFGIPSVCYPEPSYVDEFGGCFIEAETIDKLVEECQKLKENKDYYFYYSKRAISRASEYHISRVSRLYYAL
jgi:hypothetical protein